ncbi:MAG: aldo/keto reductase [Planctomycetota bacterium]
MEQRPFGAAGELVSAIGFGAAPLGGEYGGLDDEAATRAVQRALDLGVNVFDTSPYYGRTLSETRLGKGLAGRRSETFLITKCGRYDTAQFDFSPARVATSVTESLTRLQTDHVDLLIAHDVEFGDLARIEQETLPALVKERDAGRARYIGVSGYPVPVLMQLMRAFPVDAVLTYCHYDLLSTDAAPLIELADERGVAVINGSTLHMGVLTEAGAPEWHPAPEAVKAAGRAIASLCRARGREVVEVALRFALDLPGVACTLVGMKSEAEVASNVAVLERASDPALLAEIAALVAPVRDLAWPSGRWAPPTPPTG